ncbi:MCE family protein [Grimontia hollisae]|uniref:intermembrane transport protein PqiB n=1 Tax=Grimontia hollisae TaxID=673 RepID=UPI00058E6637|nr:intermembrane transport protein PqiB [Grimontia hollisae]AMG31568.1 MCE family protein [Grimontia hollisae]STO45329.1 paraquat-inducible protein B [Grimontia hollisae]
MYNNQATALITHKKQLSPMWIIPLLALLMGAWMLFQHISTTGPVITLTLSTADGIEAGKTEIKALNVKVGVITDIKLSDDYDHIIAKAQMSTDAERMLREDTRFWVVKPRIGREGVSGLDTLLSGSYLQLQPGFSDVYEETFKVLDVPPVAPPDAEGLRVVLTHNEAGKLSVGDPVLYEGFTVGRVEQVSFDVEKRKASYQLFVFAPYDGLITSNTNFWMDSGISLQMSAEGFEVQLGSLESMLKGGVTFGAIDDDEYGIPISQQMTQFRLFDDLQQVREGMYNEYLEFVMLFDESVRGLKPHAPVEYRGLPIGSVVKVPLRTRSPEQQLDSNKVPVLVRIELGRIYQGIQDSDLPKLRDKLEGEFQRGLRGTLKTGNLVTGALYIDVDYHENTEALTLKPFDGYAVFPTVHGGFAEVQKQIIDLMKKVNGLPLEDTIASLNSALKASERTLRAAENVASNVDALLSQNDTQTLPSEMKQVLQQLEETLAGFDAKSTLYQDMASTLQELNKVLTEVRPVVRQLNEKPNALVFGSDDVEDPVPERGTK